MPPPTVTGRAENISVSIRIRPPNEREHLSTSWRYEGNTIIQTNPTTRTVTGNPYTFDHIFGTEAITAHLYNDVVNGIIQSTMDGMNGTIFAYGQTSSGKTFTMRGDKDQPGVIPLAVRDVFSYIQQCPAREFLLRVSYFEIYNETIRDLLNHKEDNLRIHEDPERGVFVGDLTEEIVLSEDNVMSVLEAGEVNRHVGATNMNERSSRSHTIFRMVVESRERATGDGDDYDAVRVSTLNLVDLAGSERSSLTGAEAGGTRFKEGAFINKSLLTLGKVIGKLSDGPGGHIPFRDSKLTRILEPSLGGNARTAIICTITPALAHVEETHSTLRFASRAKTIKNKAHVNEILDDQALLKRYRKEIQVLKRQLVKLETSNPDSDEIQKVKEHNQKMEQELRVRDEAHAAQETKISRLTALILTAQPSTISSGRIKAKAKAKSVRRETWCPGRLDDSSATIPELPPLPSSIPEESEFSDFATSDEFVDLGDFPAVNPFDKFDLKDRPARRTAYGRRTSEKFGSNKRRACCQPSGEEAGSLQIKVLEEEKENLRHQLYDALQQNDILGQELQKAQEDLDTVRTHQRTCNIDEIKEKCEVLRKEKLCMERELKDVVSQGERMSHELDENRNEIETLRKEVLELRCQLHSPGVDKKTTELQHRITTLEHDIEKLVMELQDKEATEVTLRERVESLERESDEKEMEKEVMEGSLSEMDAKNKDLEHQMHETQCKTAEAEGRLAALEEMKQEAKVESQELIMELQKLRALQIEQEKDMEGKNNRIHELEDQMKELHLTWNTQVEQMKNQLQETQCKLSESLAQHEEVSRRLEEKEVAMDEAEGSLKWTLEQSNTKNASLTTEVETLHTQLDAVSAEVCSLKENARIAEARAKELTDMIHTLEEQLESEKGVLQTEKESGSQLQAMLCNFQAKVHEQDEVELLRTQVSSRDQAVTGLEASCTQAQDAIGHLQTQLDAKIDEAYQERMTRENLSGEIQALKTSHSAEIATLRDMVSLKEQQIELANKAAEEMQAKVHVLEDEFARTTSEEVINEKAEEVAKRKITQLHQCIDLGKQEKERLNARMKDLEKELSAAECRVHTEKESVKTAKDELANLKRELKTMTSKQNSVERTREMHAKEMDKEKRKNQDLREKIQALSHEKSTIQSEKASIERELRDLRKKSDLLEKESDKTKHSDTKQKETIASLRKDLETMTRNHEKATTSLERAEEDMKTKEHEMQIMSESLESRHNALCLTEEEKAKAEEKVNALHTAVGERDEALETLSHKYETLQQALHEKENAITEMGAKLEEIQEERLQLTQAHSIELTEKEKDAESARQERAAAEQERDLAKASLEEQKKRIESEEQEKRVLYEQLTDMSLQHEERVNDLEKQLHEGEERRKTDLAAQERNALTELELRMAGMGEQLRNVESANETNLHQLQVELHTVQRSHDELATLLETVTQERNDVQDELKRAREHMERIHNDLTSAVHESAGLKAEIDHIRTELEIQGERSEVLQQAKVSLEQCLERETHELEALRKKTKEKTLENERQDGMIQSLETEKESLHIRLETALKEIAERTLGRLGEAEKASGDVETLQNRCNNLAHKLFEAHKEYRTQMQISLSKNEIMRVRIEELEQEVARQQQAPPSKVVVNAALKENVAPGVEVPSGKRRRALSARSIEA